MNHGDQRIRALSLLSGSLDSQLAVCLLRDQGVQILGLTFSHPLFDNVRARPVAEQLGIDLEVVDISPHVLDVLNTSLPREGGGMDHPLALCRRIMLESAAKLMQEHDCNFISTGDVLNQEMITQSADSLSAIGQVSGTSGWVVRPLSAKRLPSTEPENRGWLSRERLLDLEGSARKAQMEWAGRFNIEPEPANLSPGRLMDPAFIDRVRDVRAHEGFTDARSLSMLFIGRHFRLGPALKLIVGRNEAENAEIEGSAELYDLVLKMEDIPGPSCLLPFMAPADDVRKAAEICARYSDADTAAPARVRVRSARETRWLEVTPAQPEDVEHLRV